MVLKIRVLRERLCVCVCHTKLLQGHITGACSFTDRRRACADYVRTDDSKGADILLLGAGSDCAALPHAAYNPCATGEPRRHTGPSCQRNVRVYPTHSYS